MIRSHFAQAILLVIAVWLIYLAVKLGQHVDAWPF